jgi:hypothetical protein
MEFFRSRWRDWFHLVSVCRCLSTSPPRGRTSVLVDHLLTIEDLHSAGELHVTWPRNTLDLILWGLGDA